MPTKTKRPDKLAAKLRREQEWHREMHQLPGVFIPLKTVNELNDHSIFWNRQGRAKKAHKAVAEALAVVKRTLPALPVKVTFTRYSPGHMQMDSDGAFASMKFVRDAVAKFYGVDDGGDEIDFWRRVGQVTRCPGYGVRIEIESR